MRPIKIIRTETSWPNERIYNIVWTESGFRFENDEGIKSEEHIINSKQMPTESFVFYDGSDTPSYRMTYTYSGDESAVRKFYYNGELEETHEIQFNTSVYNPYSGINIATIMALELCYGEDIGIGFGKYALGHYEATDHENSKYNYVVDFSYATNDENLPLHVAITEDEYSPYYEYFAYEDNN
jgi:hypothetical protein